MKVPKKPRLAKMPKRPRASASTQVWEGWKKRCDDVCKKNRDKISAHKKKLNTIQSEKKKKDTLMKYAPKCVTFK